MFKDNKISDETSPSVTKVLNGVQDENDPKHTSTTVCEKSIAQRERIITRGFLELPSFFKREGIYGGLSFIGYLASAANEDTKLKEIFITSGMRAVQTIESRHASNTGDLIKSIARVATYTIKKRNLQEPLAPITKSATPSLKEIFSRSLQEMLDKEKTGQHTPCLSIRIAGHGDLFPENRLRLNR